MRNKKNNPSIALLKKGFEEDSAIPTSAYKAEERANKLQAEIFTKIRPPC